MPRTALISSPKFTWREFLAERKESARLVLDPADLILGGLGQIVLAKGDRFPMRRFLGSLDALRAPHLIVGAISAARDGLSEDAVVQFWPYRRSPLAWQTLRLALDLVQPDEVLVSPDLADLNLPNLTAVELPEAHPPTLQASQRKARWGAILQQAEDHTVDLTEARVFGGRLGSGVRLDATQRRHAGIGNALYAEVSGGTLLIVADEEVEDAEAAAALDYVHAGKLSVLAPDAYDNLFVGLARANGEELGIGRIVSMDWTSLRMAVRATAVAPAPVGRLLLGSLRLDASGRELGEMKPWQV